MIGQTRLIQQVDSTIEKELFPRFSIISGAGRCGKKMLAKHIAERLCAQLILVDVKVNVIREIIDLSYQQSEPTVYLIADADKMSLSAKNALLKITEEPPRKSYFIMTLQDTTSTLETLRSRATTLIMLPYSEDELMQYIEIKEGIAIDPKGAAEQKLIVSLSMNPGDVDLLLRYDVSAFYQYSEKVVDSIGVVNGANAFKIGTKLAYKEDDDGWDVKLFLRAVMQIFAKRMIFEDSFTNKVRLGKSAQITSKYLSELAITGINKSATIDMWILALRSVWKEE